MAPLLPRPPGSRTAAVSCRLRPTDPALAANRLWAAAKLQPDCQLTVGVHGHVAPAATLKPRACFAPATVRRDPKARPLCNRTFPPRPSKACFAPATVRHDPKARGRAAEMSAAYCAPAALRALRRQWGVLLLPNMQIMYRALLRTFDAKMPPTPPEPRPSALRSLLGRLDRLVHLLTAAAAAATS
eukprot:5822552-Prymnesium_polylepis.1